MTKTSHNKKQNFNLEEEWDSILKEFGSNSPRFRRYNKKQQESWFASQLLLTVIAKSKHEPLKSDLENLYLDFKKQRLSS